jgi:repressor LexA
MNGDILTLQEMAEYLKVDKRTIQRMVKARQIPAFKVGSQWRFKKDDIDSWMSKKNVENNVNDKVNVPVVGRVAAGHPILAEENIEGTIAVDKGIVQNRDGVFALKVSGKSMVDAGIMDGDYVIIQKQPKVEQGEIAAVLIDNEATVKRFYAEEDRVRLEPENKNMEPIIVNPGEKQVIVVGKVKGVIRKV